MPLSRRVLGFGTAFIVIVVLASTIYLRISAEAAADETGAGGDGPAPVTAATSNFATDVAIAVEGAEVREDTLVLSVSASGEARAWRQTVLTSRVAGRVDRIPVRESQVVGAGEVMLALDPVDYEIALEERLAAQARSEADFRERLLFDENLPDEVQAERRRAARLKSGLAEAEIAVRKARIDLERTQVRAPFGGRVATVRVVPGALVSAGAELMTLVDLDPIRLQVQVLEGELAHLAPGGQARVRFSAFPGEIFLGEIQTINPLVDETTRTARVTVLVPNPGGRILPGMYARVDLEAQRLPGRILVPRSAILERDRRTMLFVHEDGRAKWRYVTTGLMNDRLVEVVENPETQMVEPGEVVLTGGHFTLTHDARIRLVDDHEQAETGRPR